MIVQDYCIKNYVKKTYQVFDNEGKKIGQMNGEVQINLHLNWYDARDIVRKIAEKFDYKSPHCIHQINGTIYFDFISE